MPALKGKAAGGFGFAKSPRADLLPKLLKTHCRNRLMEFAENLCAIG